MVQFAKKSQLPDNTPPLIHIWTCTVRKQCRYVLCILCNAVLTSYSQTRSVLRSRAPQLWDHSVYLPLWDYSYKNFWIRGNIRAGNSYHFKLIYKGSAGNVHIPLVMTAMQSNKPDRQLIFLFHCLYDITPTRNMLSYVLKYCKIQYPIIWTPNVIITVRYFAGYF